MKMSRRNFIKAGSATLTIPFLESLPVPAHAAVAPASGSLKRIVFFCLTNAWYEDVIFPVKPNFLTGPEGVRYLPLNSINGDISQMFTAAKFGALRSKMNLLRGFDLLSEPGCGGHRSLYALGATSERSSGNTNVTIDNVIASSSAFYSSAPFKRAMIATAASGNDSWRYVYSSTQSYLEGPSQIFKEYFAGVTLPGAGEIPSTPPDTNLTRRLALTGVMEKLTALTSSARLAAADKQKLQEHASLIRDLLPSLAASTGEGASTVSTCTAPPMPSGLNEKMTSTSGNGARLRACMDLIYMTMNCQLTNMFVFHPVIAADDRSLPMGDDAGDIYHQVAGHHHEVANYLKYKGFLFDQLLYLLNRMDSTKESNGLSMLDNSLVVVVSNDACSVHSTEDIPVITFGTLGGAIKAGNYINYQRTDAPQFSGSLDAGTSPGYRYTYNLGRPFNSFFTTLLNALKVPHSGFGEYKNVNSTYAPYITAAAKQASLPVLT